MREEIILAVNNLSVVKGKQEILQVPSLSVPKGEFLAVTGPNGSGKSTLLRTLDFLEPGFQGEIIFNGLKVSGREGFLAARRRMAMVFQDPLLLRGTVSDNAAMGLKLRGGPKEAGLEKVRYWLEKLKISHLAKRDVRTLSGGEAQRVSLARAMVLEPEVLFLDEPFTYLDSPTKAALVSELKEILTETETTALMVTHDLSDVPYLADRLLVMMEGGIVCSGSPEQVLAAPGTRKAAEYLGMENILPGYLTNFSNGRYLFTVGEGAEAFTIDLGVSRPMIAGKGHLAACIRPQQVMVCTNDSPVRSVENSKPNVMNGIIKSVYPYGYYYKLKIKIGVELTAMAPAVQFARPPKAGDPICIYLPPDKIHIMTDTG